MEDQPIEPTFYDGLKIQEIIDAALESHRSGRWVAVGTGMQTLQRLSK